MLKSAQIQGALQVQGARYKVHGKTNNEKCLKREVENLVPCTVNLEPSCYLRRNDEG